MVFVVGVKMILSNCEDSDTASSNRFNWYF